MAMQSNAPARFVRDTDLASRYGIARVTIWRWAKLGLLPAPVRISSCATRWDLVEVERRERERGLVGVHETADGAVGETTARVSAAPMRRSTAPQHASPPPPKKRIGRPSASRGA